MLKTIFRHGCRLRPVLTARLSTPLGHRFHTLSSPTHSTTYTNGQVSGSICGADRWHFTSFSMLQTWPYVFVSRRTTMLDQEAKDAGQSRTPPPLTPQDVEKRVLRICNEYDKIQESSKKNVSLV